MSIRRLAAINADAPTPMRFAVKKDRLSRLRLRRGQKNTSRAGNSTSPVTIPGEYAEKTIAVIKWNAAFAVKAESSSVNMKRDRRDGLCCAARATIQTTSATIGT